MARARMFWNLIARRYAAQPVADADAYRHKLERTRAFLRPGMQLFEFGCGSGTTALHHAPHVAGITAIDYAPGMIAIARDKARAAGQDNARFETGTVEDWPENRRYDMVMAHSILHLVADRAAVLAKVRRLLSPGGLFVSSTTCLAEMGAGPRAIMAAGGALRLLPKAAVFTPDALVAEIEGAGFDIEERWQPAPGKALFVIARAV